ncbi:MAG: M15 family metallopeptidase [Candidatus Gastranaerophilales bacterium]|nr:M15 family metallopeptidase [Candidatus Gastranaerophilales bacterium]
MSKSDPNSMTLTQYAEQQAALRESANGSPTDADVSSESDSQTPEDSVESSVEEDTVSPETDSETAASANLFASNLVGANLNQEMSESQGIVYTEGFYYAPLSDHLKRYITGVSYPDDQEETLAVTYDDLRYVHIWHYNFDGEPAEGELICNQAIAQDLVEIFYELYYYQYQIEKVLLIDEYDGDDTASMEDNNTSCFNYRLVEGSTSLSRHALGLALDINPYYNPYVTYDSDGNEQISPASASAYADRAGSFPYKIDESDLCYRLFTEHGFIWGGNWNSVKDYQHFQKSDN